MTENGGLGSPETEDDRGGLDEPLREQVRFCFSVK